MADCAPPAAAEPDTRHPDPAYTASPVHAGDRMAWLRRTSLPSNPDDVRMSFGAHLEELRSRLLRGLLAVALATGVCIAFGSQILQFLTWPYQKAMHATGHFDQQMISLSPVETFMQYFKTCIIFGIGLSAPYVIYQVWQFVGAGLYPHERRWVRVLAPASLLLFAVGVLFMVTVVLPTVLHFLIKTTEWLPKVHMTPRTTYTTPQPATQPAHLPIMHDPPATPRDGDAWIAEQDGALHWVIGGKTLRLVAQEAGSESLVRPVFSFREYLEFVNGLSLAFGLGFQIPIVVTMLILLRVVTAAQLAGMRKFVIVGIVVAAALLTPSGDISSQLLLAIPMVLLFEAGLLTGKYIERTRRTTT